MAYDAKALELAREGLEQGHDQKLPHVYRIFFYLPFEHSEAASDQTLSLHLYGALLGDAPEVLRPLLERTLDYAHRHADIIQRFGRYPHRNAILGRPSTPDETHFLSQPGSSF